MSLVTGAKSACFDFFVYLFLLYDQERTPCFIRDLQHTEKIHWICLSLHLLHLVKCEP